MKKYKMFKRVKSSGFVAALLVSTSAFATDTGDLNLKVSGWGDSKAAADFVLHSDKGTFSDRNATTLKAFAGQFSGTLSTANAAYNLNQYANVENNGTFTSYCLELNQSLVFGTNYKYDSIQSASISFSEEKASALGHFYTKYSGEANDAAFQLGLWEIITEKNTAGTGYDLNSGSFFVTSDVNSGTEHNSDLDAIRQANIWLDSDFQSMPSAYKISVVVDSNHQNLLMAQAVPEPETYAMLLAGLGLMGALARRRQRQA